MFFTRPANRKSSARISKADHTRRRKMFLESLEDRSLLAALLTGQSFFGGAGDQRGIAIAYDSGSLYVGGTNTNSSQGIALKYSAPPGAVPTANISLSASTDLTGIAASGANVVAVGNVVPNTYGSSDGVGGTEQKVLLARLDNNLGFTGAQSANFFSYRGGESFLSNRFVNESGTDFIYASGYAQANGSNNTAVLVKYTTAGGQVWRTDLGSTGAPFNSGGISIATLGGKTFVAGFTHYPYTVSTSIRTALWSVDPATGAIDGGFPKQDIQGIFHGLTAFGGDLYAVGTQFTSGSAGSEQFLIAKYNSAGTLQWSQVFGTGGLTEGFDGVVGVNGRIYAVGHANTGGASQTDAVLAEFDPATGTLLSSSTFGGVNNDYAHDITTDGTNLYVVGETRSFATGGNALGSNDVFLLTYAANAVTGSLSATFNGFGDLIITDTDGTGKNNNLTASIVGPNLVITDTTEQFVSAPAGGTLSNGNKTLTIPFALINVIRIHTMAGNDSLTVNYSGGNFANQLSYDGGTQTASDSLTLTGGGVFVDVTHSFTNASTGSVSVTGNNLLNYTGLEPVMDTLTATTREFTFTGGAETVTLADAAPAGDTMSIISSTLGESVTFANPTGTLTVNLTNGSDILNFNSLDSMEAGPAAFSANLFINGDGGDTVNFPSAMINIGGGFANIGATGGQPIQDINFTGGGLQTTGSVFLAGTGSISDFGAGVVPIEIVALNLVSIAPITISLDTNVFNIEVQGGSGGVTIEEFDSLTIGGISGVVGISATGGNVSVVANGAMTVNEDVVNSSGGNVTLSAAASSGSSIVGSIMTGEIGISTVAGPFDPGYTLQIVSGPAAIVDPGVEIIGLFGSSVDIGNGTFLSTYNSFHVGSPFTFNGFIYRLQNPHPPLAGVTFVSSTIPGFNAGRVSFNSDAIAIHLGGLSANGNVVLAFPPGGASAADDVSLNANVSANGGHVTLNAASDILHNSGSVSTTGSGFVDYNAGTGTTNGVITMADGTAATSGTGLMTLDADGNIQLSLVQTGNATGNAVTVTTTSGAITDADNSSGQDISAVNGGAILSAATGIGAGGSNATIEVQVVNLDVHNNTSGGIFVTDTAGGLTLDDLSGPTSVSGMGGNGLITANSPLTIAASAITAGGMTYTATDAPGATDHLTILPGVTVSDTTASLTFNAGDNFILNDTASISAATTATINIDAGNADPGAGAFANIFGALAAPGGASMNGAADSDVFQVTGPTATALDGITAAVTVDGFGGGNILLLNDSLDVSGDTATITHTTVEGLGGSPGTDYTYSNIAILDVTATSAGDTLTTTLGGAVASPTSFNGLVSVNVRGSGGVDNMFLHVADSLTNASLDFVRLFGDAGGDNFGGAAAADHIRPVLATGQTQIIINGDANAKTTGPVNPGTDPVLTSPDRLFLDLTTTDSGATVNPVVIVDTNGGYADAANTVSFRYNGIEDIDLYDGGVLTNTAIGDFFVRATDNADYIQFMSAAQVNPVFRIRIGNIFYPTTGGNYGPYTTGGATPSRIFVYGRGGNDTITMYNTRLNAAFFGELGDDILTGGYGNDLIVGGAGNDRLNGAAVGGNDEIWGDDFNPATDDPAVASQAGTGNDQINTYGGNDTTYGQGGNDIINTGAGADYINGGQGGDQLDGQSGDDRIYGGSGVDVASGSEGNDFVAGGAGNDALYGRSGNDILIGGGGQDIVNGEDGSDVVVGDESNGAGSNSLARGDAADLALAALMALWGPTPTLASLGGFGSAGDDDFVDTLWGGAAADAFFATGSDLAADQGAPGYSPDLN